MLTRGSTPTADNKFGAPVICNAIIHILGIFNMRKLTLLFFILMSFTVFANGKYGIRKLNSGLPKEAEKQLKYFIEPFYASLPAGNFFKNVYILWDKAKPNNYKLMIIFNEHNWDLINTTFKTNNGDLYSDSSSFQNRDDFKSLVPFEILLNSQTLVLEYYWVKSKENGISQQGGLPQFIKPRLCKGKIMPDFNFSTFEGKLINSAKLKGKFVFIDFWGTWCPGCINELPNIKYMREKISSDKLFIVGFVNDNVDSLKKYLSKNPFNYQNVLVDQEYSDKCEVQFYPTTVLVDPNGRIVNTGFSGENMWMNVLAEINNYNK
jgi:peroxiredoxin